MKIVDFIALFLLTVWFFLALYAVLSPKKHNGCRCNPFFRNGCSFRKTDKPNDK